MSKASATKADEQVIVDQAIKDQSAIDRALDAIIDRPPAITPDPDGYYQDANWIKVECDWPALAPRPGFAPLSATIDASLTFQEALAIPLDEGVSLLDLFAHLETRVRDWNVREYDPKTRTMVGVPPPAEIGKAAFFRCKPLVVEWLGFVIRQTSLNGGPNRKNGTNESLDGSAGANDENVIS